MAIFVINEWLWSDLRGENTAEHQRVTFGAIIEKFPASDHRIVIVEHSPFDVKGWNLCRNDNPMTVQGIGGLYKANVRLNSDRSLILHAEELAVLPHDLAAVIKPDDHYLVQAQLTVPGSVLVTTDGDLREAVINAGLSCLTRGEFLSGYF